MDSHQTASKESSDSDEEEEQDESTRKVWEKVNAVFEEYHLSPFALVAARKWVRLMGDPANKHLARVRDWLLLRINSKARAKPTNRWQAGCPDIVPGLRAQPLWSLSDPGFEWLAELERNYDVIKNELLDLRSASGFQPYRQPTWSTKLAAKDEASAATCQLMMRILHKITFWFNAILQFQGLHLTSLRTRKTDWRRQPRRGRLERLLPLPAQRALRGELPPLPAHRGAARALCAAPVQARLLLRARPGHPRHPPHRGPRSLRRRSQKQRSQKRRRGSPVSDERSRTSRRGGGVAAQRVRAGNMRPGARTSV